MLPAGVPAMAMPECLRDVVDEMVDWITAPAWVWLHRLATCCQVMRPCLCGVGGPAAADLRARADRRFALAMDRWDAAAAAARAQENARLAGYGLPALAADPQLGGVVGALVARFQTSPELMATCHASRDGWAVARAFAGRSRREPWPCVDLRAHLVERIRGHLDATGPAPWLQRPGRAPGAAAG